MKSNLCKNTVGLGLSYLTYMVKYHVQRPQNIKYAFSNRIYEVQTKSYNFSKSYKPLYITRRLLCTLFLYEGLFIVYT